MTRLRIGSSFAFLLLAASSAGAIDVEGVLPASLDQPRIYLAVSRELNGKPLVAKASGLADLLGGALGGALGGDEKGNTDKGSKEETTSFAVEAFLDTGASGIMLSKPTADGLGLAGLKTKDGKPVLFYDVGVGGSESFGVTAPVYVRLANYNSNTEGDTLEDYKPAATTPFRINVQTSSGLMDQLTGGLDVAGMPVMYDKVMVCDCRPIAKYDKMKTSLVAANDKTIPATDVEVALSYIDFSRFTRIEPAGAAPLQLKPNPMIGPNPFDPTDRTAPVVMTHNGKKASLTMLLDTGAASSMISVGKAKELGITFNDAGVPTNIPKKEQFELPIGGIGGSKNVHGFFVDVVQLPAARGEPVRYLKAPLLILDIDVEDPATHQKFTLDGVFGMNYLVASASVSNSLTEPGLGDIHDGAFAQFVVDHPHKRLGLKVK